MSTCDCCGQMQDALYRVQLGYTADSDNELAQWIQSRWRDRTEDGAGWICGKCEYILRNMASVGWFTMTRVESSTQAGHVVTDRKDNRFIGSLEMWQ